MQRQVPVTSRDFMVFVSSPTLFDPNIFSLWIAGFMVEQAVSVYVQSTASKAEKGNVEASVETLRNYVVAQYRNLELLRHYLQRPRFLNQQFLFPMSPSFKQHIIERYYSLDEPVIRELLGKTLSTRSRKDLDEISEKTRISLASCRRQFDNLKRVLKKVEDIEGCLNETIQNKFLLPPALASQYAHILFMCINRIDSKKRINNMSWNDLDYCVSIMMRYWTPQHRPPGHDLDMMLAADARDLRLTLTNNRDILEELRQHLNSELVKTKNESTLGKLGSTHLKSLIKAVLSICSGLSQTKELRTLFTDIAEKIIDVCRGSSLTLAEFEMLFSALPPAFEAMERTLALKFRKKLEASFLRIVTGVHLIGARMYNISG